jgi:hypothetical protein
MKTPAWGGAVDPRPPYRLETGTVVVLTGPDRDVRDAVFDQAWRASIGLGHGTRSLFVPRPLFVEYGELPQLDHAAVVEAHCCLLINGWSWDHPDVGAPRYLVPSLIVVASVDSTSGMASYIRRIASVVSLPSEN